MYYFLAVMIAVALLGGKILDKHKPDLRYFESLEFGVWWPFMSNDLLLKLDEFRHRWGAPVVISANAAALGRHLGEGSGSQHNIDVFGEVRAVDVFPTVGSGFVNTASERRRALRIAREVGFTGIGLYTDTKLGNMMHIDVRDDRSTSNPALWSRVAGGYRGISAVV